MPLFSQDDFNNIDRTNQVPDGVIESNNYYDVFKNFLHELDKLDIYDYESKVKFMMSIVNPVSPDNLDKIDSNYVFDLITCMSFHIIQLLMTGENMFESFKTKYVDIIQTDILPAVESECQALPYWE